jgi:hypothetical protein
MHFYDPKQGLIRFKRVEGIEGILYVATLNLINYFFLYFMLIGFNTDISFLDFYEKVSFLGILHLESFKHLLLILMSNVLTLIIIKDKLEK